MSGTILQHLESGCLQLTLLYLDYSRIVSRGLCVPVLQRTGQRSRAYVISFKAGLLNDMPAARYISTQLLLEAAGMLHTHWGVLPWSLIMNARNLLTCMSLAICRHAELGCTARLSEVTVYHKLLLGQGPLLYDWTFSRVSVKTVLRGLLSRIQVWISRPTKLWACPLPY